MILALVDQVKNIKIVMEQYKFQIINVAVAIIYNAAQQILLTKRGYNRPHPGKWELPGGKIARDEAPIVALCREIKEEIGLNISQANLFTQFKYEYPNKQVNLIVYKVIQYTGIAKCLEDQLELTWVLPTDLSKYDFLEANYRIIAML